MENNYPTSIHNRKCIGPCYEKNKFIIHPINLNFVTGPSNKPFCPTNVYDEVDENGTKYRSFVDECFKTTVTENIQMDILNPNITFNPYMFLSTYYNMDKYNQVIEWLNTNHYLPLKTKLRVIECSWVSFVNDIYIIDDVIVNIYCDFFLENIMTIYEKLFQYIDINESTNKISFGKSKLEINKFNIERINFLKEKLLNEDEVNKFLNRYFEKNKTNLENIELNYMSDKIIKNFIIYLENKITKSIINI